MFYRGVMGGAGDTLRPNKGHVKSASVSSSGPETTTDPLRPRYVILLLNCMISFSAMPSTLSI